MHPCRNFFHNDAPLYIFVVSTLRIRSDTTNTYTYLGHKLPPELVQGISNYAESGAWFNSGLFLVDSRLFPSFFGFQTSQLHSDIVVHSCPNSERSVFFLFRTSLAKCGVRRAQGCDPFGARRRPAKAVRRRAPKCTVSLFFFPLKTSLFKCWVCRAQGSVPYGTQWRRALGTRWRKALNVLFFQFTLPLKTSLVECGVRRTQWSNTYGTRRRRALKPPMKWVLCMQL